MSGEVVVKTAFCLRKTTPAWAWSMVGLWRHYRNGVLPFAGGLYDQPAGYLLAMEFIDREMTG